MQPLTPAVITDLLDRRLLSGKDMSPGVLGRVSTLRTLIDLPDTLASYPLDYKVFSPRIYPLFGFDLPRDAHEEHLFEWPARKVLHDRYRRLLLKWHPDKFTNLEEVEIAKTKSAFITKAYRLLLKRKKSLNQAIPVTTLPPPEDYVSSPRKILSISTSQSAA